VDRRPRDVAAAHHHCAFSRPAASARRAALRHARAAASPPQGFAGGYVGYTIGKHLLLNPEVQVRSRRCGAHELGRRRLRHPRRTRPQVARSYRSSAVGDGKWSNELGEKWWRGHMVEARHIDRPVDKISLLEPFDASYWRERAAVRADPERFTAGGRNRAAGTLA